MHLDERSLMDAGDADWGGVVARAEFQKTRTPLYPSSPNEIASSGKYNQQFLKIGGRVQVRQPYSQDHHYQMAVFSDDGVKVRVQKDGGSWEEPELIIGRAQPQETSDSVSSRYGVGQHLPDLDQSLAAVDYHFDHNKEYRLEVWYSNTHYTGDGDIDGITVFLFNGGGTPINDPPEFEKDPYDLKIDLAKNAGDVVAEPKAVDLDDTDLTYTLEEGDATEFEVVSSTGEVKLKKDALEIFGGIGATHKKTIKVKVTDGEADDVTTVNFTPLPGVGLSGDTHTVETAAPDPADPGESALEKGNADQIKLNFVRYTTEDDRDNPLKVKFQVVAYGTVDETDLQDGFVDDGMGGYQQATGDLAKLLDSTGKLEHSSGEIEITKSADPEAEYDSVTLTLAGLLDGDTEGIDRIAVVLLPSPDYEITHNTLETDDDKKNKEYAKLYKFLYLYVIDGLTLYGPNNGAADLVDLNTDGTLHDPGIHFNERGRAATKTGPRITRIRRIEKRNHEIHQRHERKEARNTRKKGREKTRKADSRLPVFSCATND